MATATKSKKKASKTSKHSPKHSGGTKGKSKPRPIKVTNDDVDTAPDLDVEGQQVLPGVTDSDADDSIDLDVDDEAPAEAEEGEGEASGESEPEEPAEGAADTDGDDELEGDDEGNEPEAPESAAHEPSAAERAKGKKVAPAKPSKGESEPESENKPENGDESFEFAKHFEVYEIPVARLKPNPSRTPSEEAVVRMVKSIKRNGLLTPIIVGKELERVVAGNTRLAAYKAMNRETIPCRVAFDANGEALSSKDTGALFQTLVENIERTDMSEISKAKAYKKIIDDGICQNAKELAHNMGVSSSVISRSLALLDKSTKAMREAIESGTIAPSSAYNIIAKVDSPQDQDALLKNLIDAGNGKVTQTAAESGARASKGKYKTGRKPSKAPLSPEVLLTEETGVSGVVVKNVAKEIELVLAMSIPMDGDNFTRFDLAKKVQARLAKIDEKKLRAELETARKRVQG